MDKIFDGDTNKSFTKIQNEFMEDDKNKTVKAKAPAAVPKKAAVASAAQVSKPDPSKYVYHPSKMSVISQIARPAVELATQPLIRKVSHAGWSREVPHSRMVQE